MESQNSGSQQNSQLSLHRRMDLYRKRKPNNRYPLIIAIFIGLAIGCILAISIFNEQVAKKSPVASSLVKVPSRSNFKEAIQARTQQINKLQKSFYRYQCIHLQPMFHYYDNRIMFFQTYDEVMLEGCLNSENKKWSVNKQKILKWNKNREITEWAYQHIKPGDKILYFRDKIYNLLEITIIAKLIGPKGRFAIIDLQELEQCLPTQVALHSLSFDARYYSRNSITSFVTFDVIIGNDTILKEKAVTSKLRWDSSMFLYSKDPETLRNAYPHRIQSFRLEDKQCGTGIYNENIKGEGYYSLTFEQPKLQMQTIARKIQANPLLVALEGHYYQFKMQELYKLIGGRQQLKEYQYKGICFDMNLDRQGDGFVYTVYGRKLYGVSQAQVRVWEQQRQAVEWIRSKQKGKVYYEMSYSFNLLVIVEIAHLFSSSPIHVLCTSDECSKIQLQISETNLDNIELMRKTNLSRALLTDIIITDNQVLMKDCLADNFTHRGAILGFFTMQRNNSMHAMRQVFVRHQLREVTIPRPSKECVGFEYEHFFWNALHPHNFYDITPSKYILYVFWTQQPEKTPYRKKFLIKQIIKSNVEVKIVSELLFQYFQLQQFPIHPAYYLLTSIQKSDFFRVYMMHHYGGGYADVKHYHFDWKPYYQRMERDKVKVACGYHELYPGDVPCYDGGQQPPCWKIKESLNELMSNGFYMFKPNSIVTKEWYKAVIDNLDAKFENLKKNPPQVPRQMFGYTFTRKDGTTFVSKYPFRWAEIANEHFTRVAYKYRSIVYADMPVVNMVDYRTFNNLDQN